MNDKISKKEYEEREGITKTTKIEITTPEETIDNVMGALKGILDSVPTTGKWYATTSCPKCRMEYKFWNDTEIEDQEMQCSYCAFAYLSSEFSIECWKYFKRTSPEFTTLTENLIDIMIQEGVPIICTSDRGFLAYGSSYRTDKESGDQILRGATIKYRVNDWERLGLVFVSKNTKVYGDKQCHDYIIGNDLDKFREWASRESVALHGGQELCEEIDKTEDLKAAFEAIRKRRGDKDGDA